MVVFVITIMNDLINEWMNDRILLKRRNKYHGRLTNSTTRTIVLKGRPIVTDGNYK